MKKAVISHFRALTALLLTIMVLIGAIPDAAALSAGTSAQALTVLPEYAPSLPSQKKDYTLMIYFVGSNLESNSGDATRDMVEILDAQIDSAKANIIGYTGGSRRWLGRLPSNRNNVLDLTREMGDQIIAQTEEPCNMGAPETLSSFVNFTVKNYPAEHYALILWDHGGGPLWGYGNDELFDGDALQLNEMTAAMKHTPFGKERKLDWVGFDACLMGTLECMNAWSPYARYYVASEELEPGRGWDYTALRILNETTDPVTVAGSIIDGYAAYYKKTATGTYRPDITLSAIDLTMLPGLTKSVSTLADAMTASVRTGGYPQLQKHRAQAISFGRSAGSGSSTFEYDLIDLGSFAAQLEADFPEQAQTLRQQIDDAVIASQTNMSDICGISMYYPFRNKSQYSRMSSEYRQVSVSKSYTSFLNKLTSTWLRSKTSHWVLPAVQRQGSDLLLPLTEELDRQCTGASYTVFRKASDNSYTPVLKQVPLVSDRYLRLHIPADPQVLCFLSDSEQPFPWQATQLSDRWGVRTYRTEHAVMLSHTAPIYDGANYEAEQADTVITVGNTADSDELQLYTVNYLESDSVLAGKTALDPAKYDGLQFIAAGKYPQYDDNGNPLPYEEWTRNSAVIESTVIPMDRRFRFDMIPCSQLSGEWAVQITLIDANGDAYATDLISVGSTSDFTICEEVSDRTILRYALFPDHAEIISVQSTDPHIILPSLLGGQPVTVIRENALTACRYRMTSVTLPEQLTTIAASAFCASMNLKEVILPDTVTAIGPYAFSSCYALQRVILPNGLKSLGKEAFSMCVSLKELDLPLSIVSHGDALINGCTSFAGFTAAGAPNGSCDGFKLADGVLFSPDGSRLTAFPAARKGAYAVPQGTTQIAYAAFRSSKITNVSLPDSLNVIGNYAFYGCRDLQIPQLPSGLTHIGFQAFGSPPGLLKYPGSQSDIPQITIGPKVSFIGEGAFDGFPARNFSVSPDNPFYSEVDGSLCTDAGTQLLMPRLDGTATAAIPDGIHAFRWDAFTFYTDLRRTEPIHLIVPESVTDIQGSVPTDCPPVIHAAAGTYAHSYAQKQRLTVDENTDLQFRLYSQTVDGSELTFQLYSDHAAWVGCTNAGTRLSIPETVQQLPVTVVGNGSKTLRLGVRSLSLPDSIHTISDNALSLPNVSSFTLPRSLRVLGSKALSCGYNFTLHDLPEGVEILGSQCLNCLWDGSFTLRPALRDIAPDALVKCRSGITSIKAEGKNSRFCVKNGMLMDAEGTALIFAPASITNAVIPMGTIRIEPYASFRCKELSSVSIPKSVTEIGERAFYQCTGLTEISIPGSVTTIPQEAFYGCTALTSIRLNEGVQEVGSRAFWGTEQLKELILPDSLVTLGFQCFRSNTLSDQQPGELRLGKNLTSVQAQAFGNLPFGSFFVDPENPEYASVDGLLLSRDKTILFCVPSAAKGTIQLPDTVHVIPSHTFYDCPMVTDVFASGLKEIGGTAFPDNSITLHCPAGSFGYRWAQLKEMPCQAN